MIETGPAAPIDFFTVTLGVLVTALLLEMALPLRGSTKLLNRWANNGALALLAYCTSYLVFTFFGAGLIQSIAQNTPTLQLASLPLWADFTIIFLLLEFMRYAIHVAMHKLPLLWRFHSIHHAEAEVDFSTAFRHHPLEVIITGIPVLALSLLCHSSAQAFLLYRLLDLGVTVFSHTNTRLGVIEKILHPIIITPRFHRTHHFAERRYTDSNYGAIVPWFDFVFATSRSTTDKQQAESELGLGWSPALWRSLWASLIVPFRANWQHGAPVETQQTL